MPIQKAIRLSQSKPLNETRDVLKKLNNSIKKNRERKSYSNNKLVTELLKDVPQFCAMCPLGAIALAKVAVPYASLFVIQLLKDCPSIHVICWRYLDS